jgi:hypothetical protein
MGFGGGLLVGVFGYFSTLFPPAAPFMCSRTAVLCACLRRCAPVCALDEHKQKKRIFFGSGRR